MIEHPHVEVGRRGGFPTKFEHPAEIQTSPWNVGSRKIIAFRKIDGINRPNSPNRLKLGSA